MPIEHLLPHVTALVIFGSLGIDFVSSFDSLPTWVAIFGGYFLGGVLYTIALIVFIEFTQKD